MAPAVQELSQLESKVQLLYLKRHFGKVAHVIEGCRRGRKNDTVK
jgi:hypothetical protein